MLYLLFRFLFITKNKKIYRAIAQKQDTTAWEVYLIAHGKKTHNFKEQSILTALEEKNIVQRIWYS